MNISESTLTDRMRSEVFDRSVTPALSYIILASLLALYRFHIENYQSEFVAICLFLILSCVPRAVIGYIGKKHPEKQARLIWHLQLSMIANFLGWFGILALAFYAVPLGSIQMTVIFGILAGITSAGPTSLIGLPRMQMLFYCLTSLAAAIVCIYRFAAEDTGFEFLLVPLLILVHFSYLLVHSQKLRKNLQLIFSQQERIRLDLAAAKDIQRSLLPDTKHQIRDLKLEILYKPCEELSGDFFEIHPHGEDLLFYVADVTSHGTASAQVTYLLKGIFKNITDQLEGPIDIAQVSKEMAQAYVSYQLNYSVGIFVGHYSFNDGRLHYVTSNFPGPILVSDGNAEILAPLMNPMIDSATFSNDSQWSSESVTVQPGQSCYVFTDGAYEFWDETAKRDFGLRGFSKLLKQSNDANWMESVYSGLQKASQLPSFKDDMTIVRLSRD